MWKLLGSVVSSFLLLRDFFGYLLPGAVFVGGLVYALGPTKLGDGSLIPGLANWVTVVAASYLCGQILAGIGYSTYAIFDEMVRVVDQVKSILMQKEMKYEPPIDLDFPQIIYYRALYPNLFIDVDRQDTIVLLRITLAVSLILNPWLTPWALRVVVLILGIIMLINGYTGRNHVRQFRERTLEAAKLMDANVDKRESRRLAAKYKKP